MELVNFQSQNKDRLRDIFVTVMKDYQEIYDKIPKPLQELAQTLYANTGLSQRVFYDDIVTCHCVFKPLSIKGNATVPVQSTEFVQQGVWNHIVVINRTGEFTYFYKEGLASDIPANTHIRIIKQSDVYQSARQDLGFKRISTPSSRLQDCCSENFDDITLNQSVNGVWRHQAPILFKAPSSWYNSKNDEFLLERKGYPKNIMEWAGDNDGNDRFYDEIGSFDQDVCMRTVDAMQNHELGKNPWGVRHVEHIHLTRFQTILTAYGMPSSVIAVLAEKSVDIRKTMLQSISEDARTIFKANSNNMDWTPKSFGELDDDIKDMYSSFMMPADVKNFVLAGSDDMARQGRLQFIHQTYTFAFGDTLQGQINANAKSNANLLSMLREILASDMKWGIDECASHTMSITKEIDKCQYPYRSVLERFGLNGDVSNKEFQSALRLYTSQNLVIRISLREAFALSKIPKTWLHQSEGMHIYKQDTLHNFPNDSELSALHSMHPFLVNTGIEISQAQRDGNKSVLKNISRDWFWLAKSPDGPRHALQRMDNKFNVTESFLDFYRLIHQLTEAVILRAITDMPRSTCYEPIEFDNGNLQIDFEQLFFLLRDSQRNYEQMHQNYHSDTFESTYVKTKRFDIGDVKESISRQTSSFKGCLELNNRLHKEYNKLIQRMNEYSTHQFSWQPFLSEPVQIGEKYTIHNISDRLSLLEEGSVMGHCVFSYMSACMNGQSVILSLKDAKDPNVRIATIELNTPHEGETRFVLNQCYGPYNREVESGVLRAVQAWVQELNAGKVVYTLPDPNDSQQMQSFDFTNDVKNDPISNGAKVSSIPYDTDAVYEAICAIERSLPNMSVPELLLGVSGRNTLTALCEQSPFFQKGYFPLKALSSKHNMSMDTVLAIKINTKSDWFDNPILNKVIPEVQKELGAFTQILAHETGKIPSPDGKLLTHDALKDAQKKYAMSMQDCKASVLASVIMTKGVYVDPQQILSQMQSNTSIERIFSEYITPVIMKNFEHKNDVGHKLRHT